MQAVDFIIEQFNPHGQLGVFCRKHIDGIAAHSEFAAAKVLVISLILHANELRNDIALPYFVAGAQSHDHAVIALGLANAVNSRYGGHNDHVATFHQTLGARQSHLLDVLVDGGVFFNEQIALRHIGLGLVVVVIADEILNCVFGKELSKFRVKLSRQSFVRRKHNGGLAHLGNDVGHGEGFA